MENKNQQKHSDMNSATYQDSKTLIKSLQENGFAKLRFPGSLEKKFASSFSEKTLQSCVRSLFFLLLPLFLVVQLISVHIPADELLAKIIKTSLDNFNGNLNFQGIEGVLRTHLFICILLGLLWYLPRKQFFRERPQMYLTLISAALVALMMICYTMIDDSRYLFTIELELIFFYLFAFTFLHLQFVFVLLHIALSSSFFLASVSLLSLNPDWDRIIGLYIAFNLFGIIYSYLREYSAREEFLFLETVLQEKKHLESLHEITERENNLKAELAQFYTVMSGEKNIHQLAQKIISYLVPHLNANVASLYYIKNENLELLAKYGLAQEQTIKTKLLIGESLLGQAIAEKRIMTIEHTSEDFYILQSGLGKIRAPVLTLVPLFFDDEVVAIIEFASIKPLTAFDLDFLQAANRSLSTALKAVYSRSLAKG
jgi:putative methionine-R-sulfoxide reductase with GAF domain